MQITVYVSAPMLTSKQPTSCQIINTYDQRAMCTIGTDKWCLSQLWGILFV